MKKFLIPFKIKLHSSVELITNSSTVIFTYSGGSLSSVKELVNEMLKVFERTETFDDLFYAGVFFDSPSDYIESHAFENEDSPEDGNDRNYIKDLIDGILKGEPKPNWMYNAEGEEGWSGYSKDTALYLLPKDEKYTKLSQKLLKYLYSTDHEGTYNG